MGKKRVEQHVDSDYDVEINAEHSDEKDEDYVGEDERAWLAPVKGRR